MVKRKFGKILKSLKILWNWLKSSVPYSKVVKLCNSHMSGVDLMDQQKSSVRFYFCLFFDLMNIACVNSYLIYNMKHPSKLSPWYKIVVAKDLIQYHQDRKRQYQCRDHLRGRTNLNRLIIMEDIYQITKWWKNDVCAMQWRLKKIEHLSTVWLVTFHYA